MRIKIKSMRQLKYEAPDNPYWLMRYQQYHRLDEISKVSGRWHEVHATIITTLPGRICNVYKIDFPNSTSGSFLIPEWWIEKIEED